MDIGRAVPAGVWRKKDSQYRTGQEEKSQKGYISPIWGEAPLKRSTWKNCVVGDLIDVMCAKFQNEIFGVTILQGVEFSIFLLIIEWTLQQCSATALPVNPLKNLISDHWSLSLIDCLWNYSKLTTWMLTDSMTNFSMSSVDSYQ